MAKTWQPLRWADVRIGDVVLATDGTTARVDDHQPWRRPGHLAVKLSNGDVGHVDGARIVPVLTEDGDDPMVNAMLTFTAAGFTLEPADPAERKQRS